MHTRFLLFLTGFAIFAGCGDPGPLGQPPQASRVSLELLTTRPLLARPWGLALDPTGRYLIVSSFMERQMYVLDAETYEPLGDTVAAGKVRGVVFSPAGSTSRMFAAAEEYGVLVGDVSPDGSLTLEHFHREYTTIALPDERTGGVYVVEPGEALIRLAPDGSILASAPFLVDAHSGIAMTQDGTHVLALAYDDYEPPLVASPRHRLLALDSDDLTLVGEVEIPHWAKHVIPLDGHGALIVGMGLFRSPLVGPVVAVADWHEGTLGPPTEVGSDPRQIAQDFGRGNPWVQIDTRTALFGTTHGILAIDTRTGETSHVEGEYDDGTLNNECCSMVWDAARKRLVVANSVFREREPGLPGPEMGRLEVYRIR
jgi:hypothetical protein